jgi:hypothetical protein
MDRKTNESEISLRDYLESLISERDRRYEQKFNDTKIAVDAALIAADKAVAAALAGQKEAVTKAEVAAEKRFESVNEFRNTLSDQQRNLMPRAEVDIITKSIADRLDKIENKIMMGEGKSTGIGSSWAMIVGGIAVLASVIALLLNAIRLFGGGQ